MGEAMRETFPSDPKTPRQASYLGTNKQWVVCTDHDCRTGAGQYVKIVQFDYEDDAVSYARDHYERTGHQVLIPFKIYERKGK